VAVAGETEGLDPEYPDHQPPRLPTGAIATRG